PPPGAPLFPYTTLFRSRRPGGAPTGAREAVRPGWASGSHRRLPLRRADTRGRRAGELSRELTTRGRPLPLWLASGIAVLLLSACHGDSPEEPPPVGRAY